MMNKLCCISLSLAARIVGTYTMSLSILMMNVFMSDFFSRTWDDDFFDAISNWSLVGLNWAQVLRYSQIQKKAQTIMVCFFIYSMLFLFASAYLVLGSISRKPKCAVPWLYLQTISIIDQTVALAIRLMRGSNTEYVYDRSFWYIPASSIYLVLSAYFWMVVHGARREWLLERQDSNELAHRMPMTISYAISNSNEPKSPSFLSQNFSMMMSPKPTAILPK